VCGGAKDVRPLRVGQCRRSGVVAKGYCQNMDLPKAYFRNALL
jgi:hypothetical protein